MKKHHKELVQYSTASVSLLSGVSLAFLSFFLNQHNIEDSILWYIAQTFVYAGSVFGVSAYMNTKFGEIRTILSNNNVTVDEYSDDDKLASKKSKATA
nr:MAG TPA: hypothetical protein [Caudoviricetes sp.]